MSWVSGPAAEDSGAIGLNPRWGYCGGCGRRASTSGPDLRCGACLWAFRRVVGLLSGGASVVVAGPGSGLRPLNIYRVGEPDGSGGNLGAGVVRDWLELGERAADMLNRAGRVTKWLGGHPASGEPIAAGAVITVD